MGIKLAATSEFSIEAYDKADLFAFSFSGSDGFQTLASKDYGLSASMFVYSFDNMRSHERSEWFDNSELMTWVHDPSNWKEASSGKTMNHKLAIGAGGYLGVGGNVEVGFDLNVFSERFKKAWS